MKRLINNISSIVFPEAESNLRKGRNAMNRILIKHKGKIEPLFPGFYNGI